MNVLSLFDGISCGQVALNRAGIKYDKYFASEIDKYAIKITQKNYPNTIQLGDIRNIKSIDLPKIDLIIGGSPCQGFSFAGKMLNFNDERSKLFFEFVRLLKECSPKYFLLENVKMKKESENIITKYLGVNPTEINSSLLSAQNRKRLYWTNIGLNKDMFGNYESGIKQPLDKAIVLKDILENSNNIKEKIFLTLNDNQLNKLNNIKVNTNKSVCLTGAQGRGGSSDEYLTMVKKISDITGTIRRITPIECERLQTLPENYTNYVCDSQRYKAIGNGWTVDVIVHRFSYMNKDEHK
jgi:DNA (cytosine-5)-methyltransferase 3A